jgi:hypothetical protein
MKPLNFDRQQVSHQGKIKVKGGNREIVFNLDGHGFVVALVAWTFTT